MHMRDWEYQRECPRLNLCVVFTTQASPTVHVAMGVTYKKTSIVKVTISIIRSPCTNFEAS